MRDFGEASKEKIASGTPVVRGREPSFEALVAAFLEHLELRRMSPATISVRRRGLGVLGRHLERAGVTDVRQMSRAEVDGFAAALRRRYSPRSVQTYLWTLTGFFRFLVDTNRLLLSPAEHLRVPRVKALVGPTITAKQAERLMSVPNTSLPEGLRDRAILELLYGTGLRRGEIVGLEVFDIDLAGGLVRVRGKGDKERVVPLGAEAGKWLRRYLEEVRPAVARRAKKEPRALFVGRSGQALTPAALDLAVSRHGRRARLRVSCHTLRRTMATEMLRGGASVVELAKILGHASPRTTQEYTRLVPADLARMHAERHPRGR